MEQNSVLLSLLLGLVQGISEFLPISSSGHLILVSWFMDGKPLPLAVNTALHFGTLLSVLIYFWKDWLQLLLRTRDRIIYKKKSFEAGVLLPALILGSVPAGLLGILGRHQIVALFHNPLSVTAPLFLVGFILWYSDLKSPVNRSLPQLRIRDGIIIGLAQACALIPGVSRSGATIAAARFQGFDRDSAARFSFLLGTPAMGGAALLHIKDFLASWNDPAFISGVLCSFVVGCLTIRFFLAFIRKAGFLVFAIYRAILASVILYLLW